MPRGRPRKHADLLSWAKDAQRTGHSTPKHITRYLYRKGMYFGTSQCGYLKQHRVILVPLEESQGTRCQRCVSGGIPEELKTDRDKGLKPKKL